MIPVHPNITASSWGGEIPFIKSAQAAKPDLRFWAVPWTPPVWMKTGYKKDDGHGGTAKKPSCYEAGRMKGDAASLTAHAQYFVQRVAEQVTSRAGFGWPGA